MTTNQRPVHLEDDAAVTAFVDEHDVALIECYTAGCAKCQAMEPILGNVARVTDIPIGLVNPGDDLALVDRFELTSVPTLVCFEDGEQVAQIADGVLGTEAVLEFLETNVSGGLER